MRKKSIKAKESKNRKYSDKNRRTTIRSWNSEQKKTKTKFKEGQITEIIDLDEIEHSRSIVNTKTKENSRKKYYKNEEEDNIIDLDSEIVIHLSENESNNNNKNPKRSSQKKENFIGVKKVEKKINGEIDLFNSLSSASNMKKIVCCPQFLSSKKIYEDLNGFQSENGKIDIEDNNHYSYSDFNQFLQKKRKNYKSVEKYDNFDDKRVEFLKKPNFKEQIFSLDEFDSYEIKSDKENEKEKKDRSRSHDEKVKKYLEEKDEKYISPELGILYHLIEEYDIEKVVDSIYKSDIPPKSKLDKCIKGLKDMYGENKLIIMIIKSMICQIKDNIKGIFQSKKRSSSFSSKKKIMKEDGKIKIEKKIKEKYIDNSSNINSDENIPIIIINDDEDLDAIKEKKDSEKNNDDEKDGRAIAIEHHYNKGKDGNIYIYEVSCLLGKIVVFHCLDKRCSSVGTLDLETKKFIRREEHSLKHCEHNYIINYDKTKKRYEIFKEIIDKKYMDAQIFREGKSIIVRYYE